jgi:hypothetical protein
MEQIEFDYPAKRRVTGRAHVGVVGSGDLEVLLEPANGADAHVLIRTSVDGLTGPYGFRLTMPGRPLAVSCYVSNRP